MPVALGPPSPVPADAAAPLGGEEAAGPRHQTLRLGDVLPVRGPVAGSQRLVGGSELRLRGGEELDDRVGNLAVARRLTVGGRLTIRRRLTFGGRLAEEHRQRGIDALGENGALAVAGRHVLVPGVRTLPATTSDVYRSHVDDRVTERQELHVAADDRRAGRIRAA